MVVGVMGKGVKTSYTRPDLKEATVLAIIKHVWCKYSNGLYDIVIK